MIRVVLDGVFDSFHLQKDTFDDSQFRDDFLELVGSIKKYNDASTVKLKGQLQYYIRIANDTESHDAKICPSNPDDALTPAHASPFEAQTSLQGCQILSSNVT